MVRKGGGTGARWRGLERPQDPSRASGTSPRSASPGAGRTSGETGEPCSGPWASVADPPPMETGVRGRLREAERNVFMRSTSRVQHPRLQQLHQPHQLDTALSKSSGEPAGVHDKPKGQWRQRCKQTFGYRFRRPRFFSRSVMDGLHAVDSGRSCGEQGLLPVGTSRNAT